MKGSDSILDNNKIIEKFLKLTGKSVIAVCGGKPQEIFAVVEQTYKRNKSRFEDEASMIGRRFNDYYIYYGPASFDIELLGEDDYLLIDGTKFYFIKKEKIKVNNFVQYYWAVIKKEEGSENVFEE